MRPTNVYQVYNYINGDEAKAALWSQVPVHIWDVDVDELDTVTFKDCYADGHNPSDRVAGEWLLLNFKYMCPTTIDSDVFIDKDNVDDMSWSRLEFEQEEEDEDEDENDSDDYEDGWHGILLTHVFLVEEERDASILDEAGFRVLKHEDTGTVIAQVGFCGMSNEANRARAGFLLAVERGWPILTEKGWRRPVR